MRVALVTDAWLPQVNGVVRTYQNVIGELERLGHPVLVVSPDRFRTVGCPTYPEIRLALTAPASLYRRLEAFAPDAIHIATEGPLGWAARRACLARGLHFTTSFHTRFPEYLEARTGIPAGVFYRPLRSFHRSADATLVATRSVLADLERRGFTNLRRWSRGVDARLFRPRTEKVLDMPGPIFLYVGRVAVEKNIEAFLQLELPGSKVVVGDGPLLDDLRARYSRVRFLGAKHGEALAAIYASADAFVFPSRTDTFGLVLLEALACGTPVAAYPVPGPLDVIGNSRVGRLHEDLRVAAMAALEADRADCRAYAAGFDWEACARLFLENLTPSGEKTRRAATCRAVVQPE